MRYQWTGLYFVHIILSKDFTNGQKSSSDRTYPVADGYGTQWMYFPDGDDVPRLITLNLPPAGLLARSSFFQSTYIEYRLYTRENVDNYVLLDQSARPLNESSSNIVKKLSNAPLKLITHGWESNADKSAVMNIKRAYLKAQDVNVIAVDWSSVSESILYPIVAVETSKVGSHVARFLNALHVNHNVAGSQVHLIGHSLGAHVMGNAGRECKYKVGRITGLDPARPLFELPNRSDSVKLDRSDADFVDVIHTCAGILGVEDRIGHADFYPNNGFAPQPGCFNIQQLMEACSHSRSHFLFADSIESPMAFPAYECKDWSQYLKNECSHQHVFMGDSVNRSITGNFYLKTNQASPYRSLVDSFA